MIHHATPIDPPPDTTGADHGGQRGGAGLPPGVARLVRHMPAVCAHRDALRALHGSWETLALLGHLSNIRSDMGATRQAFDRLTGELIAQLACETLARTTSGLGYKAQVAIDILTRNLFERTADIGFLATDATVVRAAGGDAEALAALPARFERYASLYSVYRDIVLTGTDGTVLARMRGTPGGRVTADFLRRALASKDHVEHHGTTDLTGAGPALTYSSAVAAVDGAAAGVLTLVFDIDDEAAGIFERLAAPEELLAFVDDRTHRIVLSNDPVRLPPGYPAPLPGAASSVRVAGQTCIAMHRRPPPYQGYAGPGWSALALVPCEVAFESEDDDLGRRAGAAEHGFSGEGIFSPGLRAISVQAAAIQRRLNGVVWNGQLAQPATPGGATPAPEARTPGDGHTTVRGDFSRALLAEIASTGRRTQGIFEAATSELLGTVTATILDEVKLLSGLAVDIFDRNLYERACDCRWWAEDATLQALDADTAPAVLERLNALYTVYTDILLFDASGRVVASSRSPAAAGRVLEQPWVRRCLASPPGRYAVSPFEPTCLYGDRPTYVYTAPVRCSAGGDRETAGPVGGIALVFDASPQFEAMLEAALPVHPGARAAYLRPDGSTISCAAKNETDAAGSLPFPSSALPRHALALQAGATWSGTVVQDGICYAVGATASGGYREFKRSDGYADDLVAVVAVPCGTLLVGDALDADRPVLEAVPGGEEVATFLIGSQLFGLPAAEVVECIEIGRSVRIPGSGDGAGSRHHGYTEWRGAALPLAEIDADLDIRDAAAAVPKRHAIVLGGACGKPLGLLVSDLVAVTTLRIATRAACPMWGGGQQLIARLGQSGKTMVPVLSGERVVRRVFGGEVERAEAR